MKPLRGDYVRLLALLSASCIGALSAVAAGNDGLTLVGSFDARSDYLSIAASEAPDRAVIGTASGTAIVDVTTPSAPNELAFIPGPTATHRDVAAWNGHAYVAGDGGGGLQIIDLSLTPPAVVATYLGFDTALSLSVDTFNDRLYVAGTETGLHVLDIATPATPSAVLGEPFDDFPILDVAVRFGWVYGATGDALAILNAALIPNLNLFAWINHPDATAVAARLADDIATAIVIEDRATGGRLRTLDVFDPRRTTSLGTVPHGTVSGADPGTVEILGDRLFAAWRNGGLQVRDLSDRTALDVTATYGTETDLDVVDVDPILGESRILCLSASTGLHLLALDDDLGRIEGTVTDMGSGVGERGVVVSIASLGKETTTGGQGDYALNVPPGDYEVTFDKFAFGTVAEIVSVTADSTTVRDVTVERVPWGFLQGTAFQSGGAPRELHPEGTIIRLLDTPISFGAPLSGDYLIPNIPAGTYIAEADRFGFDTVHAQVTINPGAVTQQDFILPAAFVADNFESDEGWSTTDPEDTATTGRWIRDVPVGTGAGYVQPLRDETPDPANTALITANGPTDGWIDDADVDDGLTIAKSPVYDLSSVLVPVMRFYWWFSKDAQWTGETPGGDDRLVIELSNDGGSSWVTLREIRSSGLFWKQADFKLSDFLPVTNAMRVRVIAVDDGAPSIVEAAVDDLEIFSGQQMLVFPPPTPVLPDPESPTPPTVGGVAFRVAVRPNPVSGPVVVAFTLPDATPVTLDLFDLGGRHLSRFSPGTLPAGDGRVVWDLRTPKGQPVPSGLYFYRLQAPPVSHSGRILVVR